MPGLQHDKVLAFNTRLTREYTAALDSWWLCDPREFYTKAKQEAPRMRGSFGSTLVDGALIMNYRDYSDRKRA